MSATEAQPEGRTAKEARVIAEADLARWDELGELWDDLDEETKTFLLDVARGQAKTIRMRESL